MAAEVDVVAGLDDLDERLAADGEGVGADGGDEELEGGELDGVVGGGASEGAGGVEEAGEEGGVPSRRGGVDLAAEEAEGEEPEEAVEGGVEELRGVGGVEGEEESGEEGVGVGRRQAHQGGGILIIGLVVVDGLEEVERGLAGGDKVGVLAPGRVLDDLVEGWADYAARPGWAAQRVGGGRHWIWRREGGRLDH